ncbi:restriction endonuclease subunit S [Vibrio harveyi]|uniref:restriction endonuclease subunit S n=1 Tax=Vibrio harveyi TaxID=669 RepID=UPI001EFDF4A0|nr:restriction endonuclease subunit S [Vibrio harveyi]MCG9610838.1 restriction endonuclease subunit S [Vibrio harveyi]MCG9669242.1 restriction endonuclease subunit S [Vibrio harveyi]
MVPNGWLKTDLNPFIDIKHGFAFKSEYFREEGEYVLLTPGSFYEPGGFRDQKKKTKYYVGDIPKGYLLSKGELLVAMTEQAAGLLGSTLFVPSHVRYLHNQRLGLIQIKDKNGICPEFLYLTYNSPYVRKQIAEQSTGTKVKHTSPDKLKSVICLLPPLPEQRKIAKILSTWDKAISTKEKLIEISKQQKKALMQQLLTGKKRLVNPETGKAFQGDWEEVKLGNVCSKVTDGAHHSPKSVEYGYPMFSVKDMRATSFSENTARHISEEDYQALVKQNCKPELNDILIAKDGSILKYCFVVKEEVEGVILSSIALLRPKINVISPNFIAQYFSQESVRFFVGKALTSGSGVPRIILKDFKGIHLRIPSLLEQQKIASVLTASDKDIEVLEAKLAHFKQEKKALMQQLLTGKRRVKVADMEVA